jgi:uncharacterized protein
MSSTPSVNLDVLRTLHRLHHQLTDLHERLDRGPKQIRANEANIAHREQELTAVRDESKTTRVAADQKQLQLKTSEAKIRELRGKLNTAASNREYQILKEQIAADEMAKSVLEDEIIEALEHCDSFGPKIAEADKGLAAARERLGQIQTQVNQQEASIRADIERLDAELKESEEMLPPLVRDVYQRLVRSRGEDAMAMVEDGFCGGCHQQVPLNVQAEIRMAHPMFCRSCGRLLYLAEEPGR